ncbi:carboxypeptidase-like regulatory domain-containing protein [Tenacibaculum tangerinum]|uniref:Carboxypeptidase-like regulatory domain-containing protein n=1 Tax=Tenacibaculum tangerinum TaxID=3038772 RepID=A0ABY8L5J1_9FLAO|nr:carboxypeptidase-like regulatory domain-containing protein [Tenacibaculum tangerinum]WGH76677.1 carboxypeptidase-like regulatory domain-containing protein [Tenacibaculum tangerinum]
MKKTLFLIICSTLSLTAVSQKHRKFFYATLQDEMGAVANAHVINLTTKQGTFTNDHGKFRILAIPNDTLKISFVGYETKKIVVAIHHFGIQENHIKLKKVPIELEEVELKKHDLTGFIALDSKHIKSEKEINAETLNLPFAGSRILTPAERRLHTAMTSSAGIPLDPLLNWMSGRLKKLKKLKAIEDTEKRVQNIRTNYRLYISNELSILQEDIERFIYFAEGADDFNSFYLNDEMSMIEFLQKKSIVFKKLNPKNYH